MLHTLMGKAWSFEDLIVEASFEQFEDLSVYLSMLEFLGG